MASISRSGLARAGRVGSISGTTNLCVNARDAMPEGGHLTLRAAVVNLPAGAPELPPGVSPGTFVRIEVDDTGRGIPLEIRHRIFDPFFTTKPLGKGTGLGLSTAQGIVRGHGGFITLDSEPGQGSTFGVYLPADADAEAAPAIEAAPRATTGAGRTLLVVDDERPVRRAFSLLLEQHGYRVLTAVNGKDGLAQFLEHRAAIRLVLTDLMMPVMNGLALVKAIRAVDPDIPLVAASGLGDLEKGPELAALGVRRILSKPCSAETLLEAIEEQLGAGETPR
ncbi:MAG: response regulator [Verrucomicrobia bacterium]|nr:response regulator [Verrucomicrobiota bacterium]